MTQPPSVAYDRDYFEGIAEEARRSAEVIVPIVLDLVAPRSVVDVGCGTGVWLSVFRLQGIADVMGIDGDHVDRSLLKIPEDRFRPADLRQPLALDRTFDLVLSLEVAEHLPSASAADFVHFLTQLGPIILFSAAVPFQGGREHVNEQWPEYWARLFRERDFVAIDCLRSVLWDDARVAWWYAQNLLIYVARGRLGRHPRLRKAHLWFGDRAPAALVHPKKYLDWVGWGMEQWRLASESRAESRPTVPEGGTST